MQTTKKDIKATSAEIEDNKAALTSFLAGMRVQVARALIKIIVSFSSSKYELKVDSESTL